MVGVELADLLRERQCDVQVLEMMPTAANGMARNNKFELLERLAAAGIRVITDCRIEGVENAHLRVRIGDAPSTRLPVGSALVFATGPRPQRDVLAMVEASGIPHALVGDCNVPGDFLSGLRDAWMVGLAIDVVPSRQSGATPAGAIPVAMQDEHLAGVTE